MMFQGQAPNTAQQKEADINNNDIINNVIDSAMERLQAAKDDVLTISSAQGSVANETTAGLTLSVEALREEKTQLEIDIEKMKLELNDLGDELRETQNEVLAHAFTSNHRQQLFEEQEGHESFNDYDDVLDDDDSLQHDDWKDDYLPLDSHTTTLDTQSTDQQHGGGDDDSMSIATAVTVSTTSTNSTSSSSATKKRRARKSYNSPKKWRRMIRTRRLQSIFFNTTN